MIADAAKPVPIRKERAVLSVHPGRTPLPPTTGGAATWWQHLEDNTVRSWYG